LTLDCYTYDVIQAIEIPMKTVKSIAWETAWVRGHRISVREIASPVEGSRDITELIRIALDELGE